MDETGLIRIGGHETLGPLKKKPEETVSMHETIGSCHLACPWLGSELLESDDAVRAAADRIEAVAAALQDRGMQFHYHNHGYEFIELDGEIRFDVLIEEKTIPIELDTGHALAGGDDLIARIDSIGERTELLHVTGHGVTNDKPVPIGHGNVDLLSPDEAVTAAGTDWLINEHEGENPVQTLDEAIDTVRDLC